MRLDPEWLTRQGEDSTLLHCVDTAFLAEPPARIAVAVSGGSDSVALLHTFARWAAQTLHPVEAVTLDHGLRPEASAEADGVARLCAGLGLRHTTLMWNGAQARGNVMAAARQARYAMIAQWARAQGIGGVALGHTGDDIAETFLMRLSRKAGLDGLAAMQPRFEREGVHWVRPFWRQGRAALQDYLTRNAVAWVDDPTNEDSTYARTRARRILKTLEPLGIDAEGLTHSALALSRARSALETYVQYEAGDRISIDRGDVLFDLGHRRPLHPEIEDRLIAAALKWVGRTSYGPRRVSLAHMKNEVRQAGQATLAGCLISHRNRVMRFTREHNAVAGTTARVAQVWDGRWIVEGPGDYEVRALGEAVAGCPEWRACGMPRISLLASPAVFDGDVLVAAPLAGLNPDWQARIVADFSQSLLSH